MHGEVSILAALIVGFLGSLHCIGMCGGIVGALTAQIDSDVARTLKRKWALSIAYNLGRVASYGVAGALAGFLGARALSLFDPAHARSVGLTISGLFMVALGLYIADWWRGLVVFEQIGARLWTRIEPVARRLLPVRHTGQALLLGSLWGWLPCGLVYAVLAWSLTSGSLYSGAAIMVAFGFGTVPMLLLMGTAAGAVLRFRRSALVRRLAGVAVMLFGIALVLDLIRPFHPGH